MSLLLGCGHTVPVPLQPSSYARHHLCHHALHMLLKLAFELLILATLVVAEKQVTGDRAHIGRQQVACQYEAAAKSSRRQGTSDCVYDHGGFPLLGEFLHNAGSH